MSAAAIERLDLRPHDIARHWDALVSKACGKRGCSLDSWMRKIEADPAEWDRIRGPFRAEIANKPDDLGLRKGYAALTTDVHEREFIEIQLRLSEGSLPARDRRELHERESSLLALFDRDFSNGVLDVARRCRYFRGFVEHAEVPSNRVAELGKLRQLAPIRHLDLFGDSLDPDVLLEDSLRGLLSLNIGGMGVGAPHMDRLLRSPAMPTLRWISLAQNPVGMDSVAALAESSRMYPDLAWVDLRGTRCEANERYEVLGGKILGRFMPDEGHELDRIAGEELRWLRTEATVLRDIPPDRFKIGGIQ